MMFNVKHINLDKTRKLYQLETGPVLIPIKKEETVEINDFQPAYIALSNNAVFEYIPWNIIELNKHQKIRNFTSPKKENAVIKLYCF